MAIFFYVEEFVEIFSSGFRPRDATLFNENNKFYLLDLVCNHEKVNLYTAHKPGFTVDVTFSGKIVPKTQSVTHQTAFSRYLYYHYLMCRHLIFNLW